MHLSKKNDVSRKNTSQQSAYIRSNLITPNERHHRFFVGLNQLKNGEIYE